MPEADVEVICPGMLDVLSVGKGDLKLTWEEGDEDKARTTIEEMLRKGYAIFVETDVGPARVKRFSPERMEYVIVEVTAGNELPSGPTQAALPAAPAPEPVVADRKPPKRTRKTTEKKIPVAGSKATAVGRTAGG